MRHSSTSITLVAALAASVLGCDPSNVENPGTSPSDAGTVNPGPEPEPGNETDGDAGTDSGKSCTSAASCPAPTSACVERTCNAGVCGEKPKPAGTVLESQTAGDCKRAQCDGNGKVVTVTDDTDVPNDNNDCTDEACSNGAPKFASKAAGTVCGATEGLKCDGSGTCVGCLAASDCAGQDTECSTRTCVAGVCGHQNAPLGTAVTAGQSAGDCKKLVCDGAGGTTQQNDDTDIPDDQNPCTTDACTNGVASHPSASNGTSCGQGATCLNGMCNGCVTASTCPGTDDECKTRSCTAGTCGFTFASAGKVTQNQQAGDCHRSECDGSGNVHAVIDNTDVPNDNKQCTTDACTNGVPAHSNVTAGTPCDENGGSVCNVAGACVGATSSCNDGIQNGDETGVDCGGSTCPACAPDVIAVPADGDTNVSVSTTIKLTFSAPMNKTTLTAQTTTGACSGSIQVSKDNFTTCIGLGAPAFSAGDTVATLTPAAALSASTTYKVKVTSTAQKAGGAAITAYTMATGFTTAAAPATCAGRVVISQVYTGGGNTNAPYKNDFIELHNVGGTAVDISGWSVQYAANSNTSQFNTVANVSGTIPPGGFYLVQALGGATGSALPTADASSNAINLGVAGGKVALVSSTSALASTCSGANLVDLVGFGTASCSEGGKAPAGTNTQSLLRNNNGCTDTGDNTTDFALAAPVPRNTQSAASMCACN